MNPTIVARNAQILEVADFAHSVRSSHTAARFRMHIEEGNHAAFEQQVRKTGLWFALTQLAFVLMQDDQQNR